MKARTEFFVQIIHVLLTIYHKINISLFVKLYMEKHKLKYALQFAHTSEETQFIFIITLYKYPLQHYLQSIEATTAALVYETGNWQKTYCLKNLIVVTNTRLIHLSGHSGFTERP